MAAVASGYQLSQGYPGAFHAADFAFNGNPLTVPASGTTPYQEVGRYIVPQGQAIMVGRGIHTGQDSATGRVYLVLQNATPAVIAGDVRLDVHTATDTYLTTIWSDRTENLGLGQTDPRQRVVIPATNDAFTQNYALVLMCKPDATNTPVQANSTLIMDMVRYLATLG